MLALSPIPLLSAATFGVASICFPLGVAALFPPRSLEQLLDSSSARYRQRGRRLPNGLVSSPREGWQECERSRVTRRMPGCVRACERTYVRLCACVRATGRSPLCRSWREDGTTDGWGLRTDGKAVCLETTLSGERKNYWIDARCVFASRFKWNRVYENVATFTETG